MATTRQPRQAGAVGCAAIGEALGEDPAGSGSRFRRFLLLEHPVPWGHDALAESGLPAALAAELSARAAALDLRIQLIRRRQGRYAAEGTTCLLACVEPGNAWLEHVALPHPGAVLDLDLETFAAGRPTGAGTLATRPVWLVCTHGTKDPCCAQRGLPVARALAAAGEDVWQSSHLGGDRFAANVLHLPTGLTLGRVPAARVGQVVATVEAGRVPLDLVRGRAGWPQAAQTAEIVLRRAHGLDRLDDVEVLATEPAPPAGWRVTLRSPAGATSVTVDAAPQGPPRPASCKATELEDVERWTGRIQRTESPRATSSQTIGAENAHSASAGAAAAE